MRMMPQGKAVKKRWRKEETGRENNQGGGGQCLLCCSGGREKGAYLRRQARSTLTDIPSLKPRNQNLAPTGQPGLTANHNKRSARKPHWSPLGAPCGLLSSRRCRLSPRASRHTELRRGSSFGGYRNPRTRRKDPKEVEEDQDARCCWQGNPGPSLVERGGRDR